MEYRILTDLRNNVYYTIFIPCKKPTATSYRYEYHMSLRLWDCTLKGMMSGSCCHSFACDDLIIQSLRNPTLSAGGGSTVSRVHILPCIITQNLAKLFWKRPTITHVGNRFEPFGVTQYLGQPVWLYAVYICIRPFATKLQCYEY